MISDGTKGRRMKFAILVHPSLYHWLEHSSWVFDFFSLFNCRRQLRIVCLIDWAVDRLIAGLKFVWIWVLSETYTWSGSAPLNSRFNRFGATGRLYLLPVVTLNFLFCFAETNSFQNEELECVIPSLWRDQSVDGDTLTVVMPDPNFMLIGLDFWRPFPYPPEYLWRERGLLPTSTRMDWPLIILNYVTQIFTTLNVKICTFSLLQNTTRRKPFRDQSSPWLFSWLPLLSFHPMAHVLIFRMDL